MIRLAILLTILATPALAQQQCADRIKITYPLANKFLEAPLLESIDEGGNLIEWWGNIATGTWTLLSTKPGGPTCLVMSGSNFGIVPLEPAGEPS